MLKEISYNNIWKISYPIILSLVAQNVINATDTAFLGHYGEVELGASAIAGLLYVSVYMLGFGFSMGSQIVIAMRNGERKYRSIGITFYHSAYFLFFLSALIIGLSYWLAPIFLQNIIHSKAIYDASIIYFNYRLIGLTFAYANCLFRGFFVGITDTKPLIFTAVVMALLNVVLNYGLIFGKLGMPEMGIAGSALASVISEVFAFFIMIAYVLQNKYHKKFFIFKFGKVYNHLMSKIIKISSPVMVQHFIALFGWFIFFVIIEQMGQRALAVSNIIRSIYLILMIPVWAFVSTNSSLVGNLIGANRQQLISLVNKRIIKVSFLSTLFIVILSAIFARPIISLYTPDLLIISETIPSYYLIMGVLLIFSITMIIFSTISGAGKTNIALMIEVFTIVIYLVYEYFIVRFNPSNILFAWTAEYIYFITIGIVSYWYIKKNKRTLFVRN
ncbi:MAG: MATE family efflux transporter [Bacteroidota bacterium]